mmetsp:Transcript_10965/g.21797  ORF Transcript_10965/g.21797 Transcript_10965/m.21797 type:complete len:470 (+) Transcript_10965:65-1474(+)
MSNRRYRPQAQTPLLPRGEEAAGFMFMSDKNTVEACLTKQLFGLPQNMMKRMDSIGDSSLLFLMNKERKEIHGVFRPLGRPALNIDPDAYAPLSFPAQIRFQLTSVSCAIPKSVLSWAPRFGPLTDEQVEALQTAMSLESSGRGGGGGGHGGAPVPPSTDTSSQIPQYQHQQQEQLRRAAAAGAQESNNVAASLAAATASLSLTKQRPPPQQQQQQRPANGGSSNHSNGGGGVSPTTHPDVAVLVLMKQRLEVEAGHLSDELKECSQSSSGSGGHGEANGAQVEHWTKRYSKLEEGKAAAVKKGDYVEAAAFAQHSNDLKAMLKSAGVASEKTKQGTAAMSAALLQAVAEEDFLTAALLQRQIADLTSAPVAAAAAPAPRQQQQQQQEQQQRQRLGEQVPSVATLMLRMSTPMTLSLRMLATATVPLRVVCSSTLPGCSPPSAATRQAKAAAAVVAAVQEATRCCLPLT